jgi:ATP-dependent DNA helicase RecG
MRQIEKILSEIETCINQGTFKKLEHDKLDLKDNSHSTSEWKEVFKTCCALLNTGGGIIIVGIFEDEKNRKFVITGYSKENEEKTKTVSKVLTNEVKQTLDLTQYFPAFEIHQILGKEVLAIYVDEVPEDLKYVYYEGHAYERQITGDHKIKENKIKAQAEYKLELQNAKELQPVINTTLQNLDVGKLNEYIQLLNKEVRTESIKSDIESSKSFLERKGFITKTLQPTILGVLVCANNVDDILGSRSQIDCYVDTGFKIAENKKILKDNILPLMEKGINFIQQNIQVGVGIESGGKSIPEYPIRLIRESVNNSLAHRDYGIIKFTNINIVPNKHIEIRNPGRFKEQLLIQDIDDERPIRRIIPGNSKPNNPRLAEILKVFDKWEGKGLGMSTLTNECLANNTDLPYYKFHSPDELSLYIKKGRLLDEKMESLINAYAGYIEMKLKGEEMTFEQKLVLSYFYKSEIENKNERYTILLTKDNNHLEAINSLEDSDLIYRHSASTELYSVYVTDRQLFRKDFIRELRKLFGADFDALSKEGRDALTAIYEFNNYSKDKYPSANLIGNTLWAKAGNANVLNGYEDFKRRIRKIVNNMEKRGIIKRVDNKPLYMINSNFQKRPSIYDDWDAGNSNLL